MHYLTTKIMFSSYHRLWNPKFSDAEKELMKRLKLKPSDLLKLRSSLEEEEEDDYNDELDEA